MKFNALVGALALLSWSCVPSDSPIRIGKAHPVEPGPASGGSCTASSDDRFGGALDISGSGGYLIQFDIESEVQSQQISNSSGETMAGNSRADFIAKEIVLSYTSTPSVSIPTERQPAYIVIPAGESEKAFLNILTVKAVEALQGAVMPGDFTGVSLSVGLQVNGMLASGVNVISNKAIFPIHVYNSGFTGCPLVPNPDGGTAIPDTIARNGPCGNVGGQDNAPIGCCSDPLLASSCSGT